MQNKPVQRIVCVLDDNETYEILGVTEKDSLKDLVTVFLFSDRVETLNARYSKINSLKEPKEVIKQLEKTNKWKSFFPTKDSHKTIQEVIDYRGSIPRAYTVGDSSLSNLEPTRNGSVSIKGNVTNSVINTSSTSFSSVYQKGKFNLSVGRLENVHIGEVNPKD